MFKFLNKFFDSNEKELRKLETILLEINSLESKIQKLKDSDFPKKTKEVREAARRGIGQRHFDVQLIAGAVLASGKIAEQKTGEGKTLSAVPALYLHNLTGKNIHLVTVNDYLASRDAGWMGPIFNLLGITVSSIINDTSFIFDPNFVNKKTGDPRLSH